MCIVTGCCVADSSLPSDQVHKAHPIRKYKPVEVKKCDTALTVPQSPNFSNRFHL